ncbi:MAG TPA: quinoprotein relay system zinc metallohydrolase 2 [Terriglobales bacterium]|nr:quinoprotein relay system zinc metallohydrolase 2 [Terriglobales bacterium]
MFLCTAWRWSVTLGAGAVMMSLSPAALPDGGPAEATPLAVREIAPGIYVHQGVHAEANPGNLGGIANIGFVVGAAGVAVIDTGGSHGEGVALLAAIRQITSLPVRYVINTHFHPDHILGNDAFVSATSSVAPEFVAHANFPRDLAARQESYLAAARQSLGAAFAGTQIVVPQHLIGQPERIDLGNRELLLTPYPPAHSDADLTVLDLKTRTLFAGDLLFVDRVPAVDGSITGWLKVLDALKQVDASRAVPGHGPASVPWPAALKDEQHYLSEIVTAIRQALKQNRSLQQAVEEVDRQLQRAERSKWQLFDDYDGRNITAAYTELEWE